MGTCDFLPAIWDIASVAAVAKHYTGQQPFHHVPSLPDCWVWVSRKLLVNTEVAKIDVKRGIRNLVRVVPEICETPQTMLNEIREEKVRIVTVSRARYNPRFRGRLIVDGSKARKVLLHATLCLASSQAVVGRDLSEVFL